MKRASRYLRLLVPVLIATLFLATAVQAGDDTKDITVELGKGL